MLQWLSAVLTIGAADLDLTVPPTCDRTSSSISLHVEVPTRTSEMKKGERVETKGSLLWSVFCSIDSRECWGVTIDMGRVREKRQLGMHAITSITNARYEDDGPSVIRVISGAERLTVDFAEKKVSYAQSGKGEVRGEASCVAKK